MAENRGKKFEYIVRTNLEEVPGVSVDRLHDQMTGFKGSQNICDFIAYKKPYEIYIECKSVHGNTLPFSNITETQWNGLLDKSKISGVIAGILCWWIDWDQTWFVPIQVLQDAKETGEARSLSLNKPYKQKYWIPVNGKKRRVFFDYDMNNFFQQIDNHYKLLWKELR